MSDYDVRSVLGITAELGESPSWSAEDQAVYWIDTELQTANRFDENSGNNQAWDLPMRPGCMVLRDDHGAIIAGEDGIYDLDFTTAALTLLVRAPYDSSEMRFNDGQVDRQGRLWVGSMPSKYGYDDDGRPFIKADSGAMYCFDGQSLSVGIEPITIPNGCAFSPDGRTMYRAESYKQVILAYDYDPDTARVSNERQFAQVADEIGIPDGATVDASGGYWCAAPNLHGKNASILRFAPDGSLDLRIEMPVQVVTMVIFGGADLSTLYATTGYTKRLRGAPNISPLTGNLLAIDTPFRGLAQAMFCAGKRSE